MALVSVGFRMVVTLLDSAGDDTTKTYNLVADDEAEAATAGAAIRTALPLVSGSVVASYFIGEVFQEDALTLPTDVENGVEASVTSYIAGAGQKKADWKIPGALALCFVAASGKNRNVVNLAHTNIIQYNSLFVTGAGQRAYISDGEALKASGMIKGVRVVGGKRQPTS